METNKNKNNDKESSQENNELGTKRSSPRFFSESLEPEKKPVMTALEELNYLKDVLNKIGNAKLDKSDVSIKEAQQAIENCINQIEKIVQPTHSPPSSSPS